MSNIFLFYFLKIEFRLNESKELFDNLSTSMEQRITMEKKQVELSEVECQRLSKIVGELESTKSRYEVKIKVLEGLN